MGWLSKLFNLEPETDTKKSSEKAAAPEPASKNDACNRLKLVLMHDRTKLSAETIEQMRKEMIDVISKYVEIDQEALNLHFESEGNTIALAANVPILKVRNSKEKTAEEPKKAAVAGSTS